MHMQVRCYKEPKGGGTLSHLFCPLCCWIVNIYKIIEYDLENYTLLATFLGR